MLKEREPDFPLTQAERELLEAISFDLPDGYQAAQHNGEAVCALMKSLIARKGIPELRVKWFTDPAYFPGGRGKSRQQVFERNGRRGEDIFRHPHFLEYLWTFLYGANLPAPVIAQFRQDVKDCGQVTSGDIAPLGKKARAIARAHGLPAHDACEEFYKLALECGIWHSYAEHIRDAVKQMR
jgi:hypothetical protein